MADTVRLYSEILALFADNTTRDISEQDLRDFIVSAMSPKVKFTPEGGLAVRLINKTGAASVHGNLVSTYSATAVNEAFRLSATTSYEHVGVVYEAGVADGSLCWVVVSGIAEILIDNSQAVALNDLLLSSTSTAGRADVAAAVPPVSDADHFREVGHAISSCTAGTDNKVKVLLHFN